jgi:hypothetical protein
VEYTISGKLIKGYQVASGIAQNTPFEGGTIELQKPFFKHFGLNLDDFFMGTLNIDISPYTFKIVNPTHTFKDVKWTLNFPAETFSFAKCKIKFMQNWYEGYIYYPHPETKIGHFQKNTMVELLAPYIEDIAYGNRVELIIYKEEIELYEE